MKAKGYGSLKTATVIVVSLLLASTSLVSQPVWQPTSGPYSGRILAMATDAKGNLFAGTHDGGIYTSDPSGSQWRYLSLVNEKITCFYITSAGEMYAGTLSTLLKSTDNGTTWNSVGLPGHPDVLGTVVNASGHIFAGGWKGMFRTTDGGQSWDTLRNGLDQQQINTLAIDENGKLYMGTRSAVLCSTDNGDSWFLPDSTVLGQAINDIEIGNDGEVFAASYAGALVSLDHGTSWTLKKNGMRYFTLKAILKTSDGSLYAGTGGGSSRAKVYKSTDNGETWSEVHSIPGAYVVESMAENATGVFVGTSGVGMYLSTNKGATWLRRNAGLTNTQVRSMIMNTDGDLLASGVFIRTAMSTDKGDSWQMISERILADFARGTDDILWAAAYQGGVFHSSDKGRTWLPDTAGIARTGLISICVSDKGHVFAGGRNGIMFRSTDNGASWEKVASNVATGTIMSLVYDKAGYLFAGMYGDGLFRSSDNGNTWTPVARDAGVWISELLYNSQHGIYAGGYGILWRSTDHGDSWSNLTYNLKSGPVFSIVLSGDGTLIIGQRYDGVAYLDASTKQWVYFNDGLYNRDVNSLVLHPDGFLFAGTEGSGIFRSRGVPTEVDVLNSGRAASYTLGQNYPNPVSISRDGLTTIPFVTTSGASHAQLVVYDHLGRVVREIRTDGRDAVELDVRGMSPGIYMYRLSVGRESRTKLFNVIQ